MISKTIALGVAVVVLAGIGLFAMQPREATDTQTDTQTTLATDSTATPVAQGTPSATPTAVSWSYNGSTWSTMGDVPTCPTPFELGTPVPLADATNILYPGQSRSGNYKPHGGFRFDNAKTNDVAVTLALDAYLYRGSRYLEVGEAQIMLDFIHPCGYLLRYDHLLTLTPEFQALVDATFPATITESSATTNFPAGLSFKQGTQIASAVGHTKPSRNVAVDFGVYDLRAANDVSKTTAFQAKVGTFTELSNHGVCWLNLLSSTDSKAAIALPGSGTEGKVSDYCN